MKLRLPGREGAFVVEHLDAMRHMTAKTFFFLCFLGLPPLKHWMLADSTSSFLRLVGSS
jgi:hypothetical protein